MLPRLPLAFGLLGQLTFGFGGHDVPTGSQSLQQFACDGKVGFRDTIQKRVQIAAVNAHGR